MPNNLHPSRVVSGIWLPHLWLKHGGYSCLDIRVCWGCFEGIARCCTIPGHTCPHGTCRCSDKNAMKRKVLEDIHGSVLVCFGVFAGHEYVDDVGCDQDDDIGVLPSGCGLATQTGSWHGRSVFRSVLRASGLLLSSLLAELFMVFVLS